MKVLVSMVFSLYLLGGVLSAYGQNVDPSAYDVFNSNNITLHFWEMSSAPSITVELDGRIIMDTANTAHLTNAKMTLRLGQGNHILTVSTHDNLFIGIATFSVISEFKFSKDTTGNYCGMLILSYRKAIPPVKNYRELTIEKEYLEAVRRLHLTDRRLKEVLKKELVDSFEKNHGQDYEYTGIKEGFVIEHPKCHGGA
ncbi:MAG: hypothetical protein EOO89_27960 [Pedobacter sp.]|nr:MAG: hypothetical protein EOO89_27960 [Pedobacter sp.]